MSKTANEFIRQLDPKIRAANRRMVTRSDRLANLEDANVIRERSRNRNVQPSGRVAAYLELAKRARMLRAGMHEALELREELVPLASVVG